MYRPVQRKKGNSIWLWFAVKYANVFSLYLPEEFKEETSVLDTIVRMESTIWSVVGRMTRTFQCVIYQNALF